MSLKIKSRWFVLFLFLLGSLVFWPALLDKYLASRFIWINLVLLLGGISFYSVFRKLKTVTLNLLDLAFLAYFSWAIISVLWSMNLGEALFNSQRVFILFFACYIFRILLSLKNSDMVRSLLFANSILTFLLLCLALIQIIIVAGDQGIDNQSLYDISGVMGNKSLLSEFFFLLLPLNLIAVHQKFYRNPVLIILSLQFLVIFFLQVRTVYLAIAICGLLYIVPEFIRSSPFRKLFYTRILPLAFLLTVGFISVLAKMGTLNYYVERLKPSSWIYSATTGERMYIWSKTMDLVQERPLLGVGSGNWKVLFPSNNIEGAWRFQTQDVFVTRAHNDYLEILAELGYPGLILFLSIFGLVLYAGLRAMFKLPSEKRHDLRAILAGIMGYLIISYFDFPKERFEHQILLAILIAYVAAKSGTYLKIKPVSSKFFPVYFGTFLIICGLNIIFGAVRFNGEIHNKLAIQAKLAQNWPRSISEANKAYSPFYDMDPTTVPVQWYAGMGYFQTGETEKAFLAFKDAYEVNPFNFHVLNNLGTVYAQKENFDEAIPLFREALRINPKFEDAIFNLGFSLSQTGELEEAYELVQKTSESEKKQFFLKSIRERMSTDQ